MGLQKYHSKRDFKKTSEPKGHVQTKSHDQLHFVVQEHHASTLHCDFRLEMQGVLKSWAVPKGPSDDPQVKRLAVEVEDHPLEYAKFQGVIAKGEYGAGRVIRWDSGTWSCEGNPVASFKKGHIDFTLKGKKLHGRWVLVRTKRKQGTHSQWLLMKRKDDGEIQPKIKTLDHHEHLASKISPELAQLVRTAPDGDDWLHEIKFDGYRLQCRIEGGEVKLITRQGLDWTDRFSDLRDDIEKIGLKNTILDGEVVCLNSKGVSDFGCLQDVLSHSNSKKKKLIYYVFDLLFLNGNDLRNQPLLERKKLLTSILKNHPSKKSVKLSEHIIGQGPQFFKQACQTGLEGIISKRAASPYISGRGDDWVKTKCENRQEFVIGGYTDPQGSRLEFGALLLGLNEPEGLRYVGKTGTGFDKDLLQSLKAKFKKIEQRESPFHNLTTQKSVHWLKPKLVAEISFAGWTKDKNVRQASFRGLREDKAAKSVVPDQIKDIQGVELTHPDKILFKDTKITKKDLANYYASIADKMLMYLKNRPLTILRCPAGTEKSCFYQRHIESFSQTYIHEVQALNEKEPYFYIDSLDGLRYLAQMGALEIHVWNSTIDRLTYPDTMIFDLDPDQNLTWKTVIGAAFELREVLEGLDLKSFVKLSGGKGLHVQVPILPEFEYEKIKNFTHSVVKIMMERNPELYTDNMRKDARKRKIFIDYLRNAFGATAIAPYGTRNRPGTPVALPLDWDELNVKIKSDQFSIPEVLRRLKRQKNDPWAEYFKLKQSIKILK